MCMYACMYMCVCMYVCVCVCVCVCERESERERQREIQRQRDSDGLLLPGFKPIERGGWGEGVITNTKRSTHVHILNIMDTAMLFLKSDRDMFSLSQIWPHLPRIKQFVVHRMSTDFCCCSLFPSCSFGTCCQLSDSVV